MKKIVHLSIICLLFQIHSYSSHAQEWADVDGGTTLGAVFTLYTDSIDDLLYVGGIFDTVGPNYYASAGFATYDGGLWNDLAGHFGEDATECITRFKDSIYHAGILGGVYIGKQTKLNQIGDFNKKVLCLAVYHDELYAGGNFTSLTQPSSLSMNHIAKWNGTVWQEVGGGIKNSYSSADAGVHVLYVYNGELYAGGLFDTAGTVPCKNIVKWNGTEWQPIGSGVKMADNNKGKVICMTTYHNALMVGGIFNTAGDSTVGNLAMWKDSVWQGVNHSFDKEVDAVCEYNSELYAGGAFSFDGITDNHIAKWNGSEWTSLGEGMTDGGGVNSLTTWRGSIIVGGRFTQIESSLVVSNLASFSDFPIIPHDTIIISDSMVVTPGIISNHAVIHLTAIPGALRQVEVLNNYGRKMDVKEFSTADANIPVELNTADWAPGIYIVRVYGSNGVSSKKILVL